MTGSNTKPQNDSDVIGGIFIHTLSHFHNDRAGTYILQSLKKMTGTKAFLGLPNDQKECQTEKYQQCVEKIFRENVLLVKNKNIHVLEN